MKKLTIGLLSTIAIMAVVILFLLSNALSTSIPRIRLIERSINQRDYTKFVVSRGTLEDIYKQTAEVISLENPIHIDTIDVSAISSTPKVQVHKQVGEKFEIGDLLYTVGSNPVLASSSGKVISHSLSPTEFTFSYLDYELLVVKTFIPQSLEQHVTSQSKARVVLDGQAKEASVESIGSMVVAGQIEVIIRVEGMRLLPGSLVETQIVIQEYANVSYVPSQYIYNELGINFIYLLAPDGKSVSKLNIVIVQELQSATMIQSLAEQYYYREFIVYND